VEAEQGREGEDEREEEVAEVEGLHVELREGGREGREEWKEGWG